MRLTVRLLVQIITYTKDMMSFGPSQFEGRVRFQQQMPSFDVSILINNTQESDSGRYACQVIIPGGPAFTRELNVEVKGKSSLIRQHDPQLMMLLSIEMSRCSALSSSRCAQVLHVGEAGAERKCDSELLLQLWEACSDVPLEEDQPHLRGLLLPHAQ